MLASSWVEKKYSSWCHPQILPFHRTNGYQDRSGVLGLWSKEYQLSMLMLNEQLFIHTVVMHYCFQRGRKMFSVLRTAQSVRGAGLRGIQVTFLINKTIVICFKR